MKFKITIIDMHHGEPISEIVEESMWPMISFPQHNLRCGSFGVPIKVEAILEASAQDTTDHTGN